MRRRTKPSAIETPITQEIKTEFTSISSDQQISLDINKDSVNSNSNPYQVSNQTSSSQSSEYEEEKSAKRKRKNKRSSKKSKKQALKYKKTFNKMSKQQDKSLSKHLSTGNQPNICRKYSSLFFSEQSLNDEIQKDLNKIKKRTKSKTPKNNGKEKPKIQNVVTEKKEKKPCFWQKIKIPEKTFKNSEDQTINVKKLIQKYGELHITDYEEAHYQDENVSIESKSQVDEKNDKVSTKLRYIFEPKYIIGEKNEKDLPQKIALSSDEISENHALFVELVRFYRNMRQDHATIAKMFI